MPVSSSDRAALSGLRRTSFATLPFSRKCIRGDSDESVDGCFHAVCWAVAYTPGVVIQKVVAVELLGDAPPLLGCEKYPVLAVYIACTALRVWERPAAVRFAFGSLSQ